MDRDFPFRFDEYVRSKRFNVETTPSERSMLGYFLAKLHRIDPDIIVVSWGLHLECLLLGQCPSLPPSTSPPGTQSELL